MDGVWNHQSSNHREATKVSGKNKLFVIITSHSDISNLRQPQPKVSCKGSYILKTLLWSCFLSLGSANVWHTAPVWEIVCPFFLFWILTRKLKTRKTNKWNNCIISRYSFARRAPSLAMEHWIRRCFRVRAYSAFTIRSQFQIFFLFLLSTSYSRGNQNLIIEKKNNNNLTILRLY